MNNIKSFMLLTMAFIFFIAVHADITPAFAEPPATPLAGPYADAAGGIESYCPADGTLFARIMTCLENTVIDVTIFFLEQFYPPIRDVVIAVLTLAVIIYGAMMAIGGIERLARDTVTFLLKFGGVIYFINEAINLYIQFVNMLMGTLNEIGNATTFGTNLKCPSGGGGGATTTPMWERADCVFDLVIGLSSQAALSGTNGQEGLARGMMGFFYYNLQSGALGILIGLAGLYISFNLVMALIRASYTYLIALITMSFLFIIGILFVPLIIFRNSFEYFERWVKMVISMILQPLILFAYLNVLLTAFDIMLYSGENSLMRTIAGDAVDADDFNIHEYAETNGLYSTNFQAFTHDVDQSVLTTQAPEENDGTLGNIEFIDQAADYADLSQMPIDLQYRTVDYEQVPGGAAALAGATLLVGLASYILVTFMNDIPTLANDLAGGVNETPSVIAGHTSGVNLPFAQQVSSLQSGFGNTVRQQFGNLVGRRG